MTAVLLALSASAAWGLSEFLGGLEARRVALWRLLVVSQLAGAVVIAAVLVSFGPPLPADDRLLLGVLAGVAGVGELSLVYLAIARGPTIVVAPIAGLGAAGPVTVGLLGGDRLTGAVGAGLACALAGTVAASWPGKGADRRGDVLKAIPLVLAAAAGVGVAFVLLDRASQADPLWAAAALRVGGAVATVAIVAVRRGGDGPAFGAKRLLAVLAAVGICDVAADLGFAGASSLGDLSTTSVLASLYPVVTVGLGVIVWRERPGPVQLAGVGLAVTGVALLGGA